jgi:hypothetical protein
MHLKQSKPSKMLVIFILVFVSKVFAQDDFGLLNINSEPEKALVYIDSKLIGLTPVTNLKVKPGTYILKVKNPEISDWLESDYEQRIDVRAGDTLNLFVTFDKYVKINSIPFGADIFLGDSILGVTPSVFKLKELVGKRLKISKKGYDEVEIFIDGKARKFEVNLKPKNGVDEELRKGSRDKLKMVLPIAGISLSSGLVSIYFKTKADALYDEYLKTGDAGKLNTIKTYDRVSAFTLIIFEATTLLGIYILLSD